MRGQRNTRRWEETASAATGHVGLRIVKVFFAHLISINTERADNIWRVTCQF